MSDGEQKPLQHSQSQPSRSKAFSAPRKEERDSNKPTSPATLRKVTELINNIRGKPDSKIEFLSSSSSKDKNSFLYVPTSPIITPKRNGRTTEETRESPPLHIQKKKTIRNMMNTMIQRGHIQIITN